ncbi:TerD family protein [Nocardioides zeae]|uniref:TerD family protein n=1 Tax=Nocardioides imazamoxiresistens TaxID=3231893 RepID=A0ABU3PXH1_9ACTN|nr:TerD family protein [Nocardioides zeae]MDT9593933.1 TerD family protein [Nocardioides zeae]
MTSLVKGANAPLSATRLSVTVDVSASADLSALLVTEQGKVRSDADFVFYNQPQGPGVTCVPPNGGGQWRVDVDLTQVPADVHAVRFVTSLDDGGKVFGQVGQPVARVSSGGSQVAEFAMTGLDRETIVVAVEFYRRNADWKVRAVGRGYDGGLADLIADHGVSVDDAPAAPAAAPAPAPAPAPTPAPAPAPAPTPAPAPQQPPSAPTWGTPSSPPPPAPPAYGQQPPAAPTYGQQPPAYGQQQPPAYGQQAPQQPPAQQPPAPQQGGEVSLRKGASVSLQKGQRVSLQKDGGQALTQVRMGLGWDPLRKGGLFGSREVDIDLDASVVLFAGQQAVDLAFYNNLTTRDGSVRHLGDNRTGDGDGDDETIVVDLTRVPVHVDNLVFIVTSYQGQTFQDVSNAFCRLIDQTDGELARFTLAGGMPFTALVMAKVYREGGGWKMQAIGDGFNAKVPSEAIPQLTKFL